MKTKNNVQKAILRSAAVVISFILISLTVSAQDFWKKLLTNSSFNEIAIAMTETSKKSETPASSTLNSSDFFMSEETEEALKVEDWMTNESTFNSPVIHVTQEQEKGLEVEDWMMNEHFFENDTEVEPALKVEDWMTSDKVWNI